jgi:septal ring factor EnvC (AmiA/AmiB activator)
MALLFLFAHFHADGGEMELDAAQRQELGELRKEIQKFEKELSKNNQQEAEILSHISTLDREIDVTKGYLNSLTKDVRIRERQIKNRQNDIEMTSAEISRLQELLKDRIVHFYKHSHTAFLETLFASKSLSQVQVWMRYQKMIYENDKRNIESLASKKAQLEQEKDLMNVQLTAQERRLKEREQEKRQLVESREKRDVYLKKLQNDKAFVSQRLKEVREAERQILGLIARAEEDRLSRKPGSSPQGSPAHQGRKTRKFADLKGKLIWPTQGSVISHFGRQKHPQLKTVTENLGIEIKANLGTPVRAVDEGWVQAITWQRGRGNIIIISHDDGFYTVYTHLAEILVETNQFVQQGQVIGTVGDSGSLNGPVLHFQIWENTQNLNPEDWLT